MLIDSRATIDTIVPYAIARVGVSLKPKKEPYELILIDREPHSHNNSWITKKIVSIIIKIQDY